MAGCLIDLNVYNTSMLYALDTRTCIYSTSYSYLQRKICISHWVWLSNIFMSVFNFFLVCLFSTAKKELMFQILLTKQNLIDFFFVQLRKFEL